MTADELEALLSRGYAQAVGVADPDLASAEAELAAALAGGDVARGTLEAKRDALRRVEARCAVSLVQRRLLDRVLA